MHGRRPSRLPGFSYLGFHRYFITISAVRPGDPFSSPAVVAQVLAHLRQHAAAEELAVVAYCFMPDHVHLVLQGCTDASDLRRCIARWKQVSGYWYRQQTRRWLWLPGYHDRVIRDTEPMMRTVRYVLRNPVRAGLARRIGEYAFAGSDVYSEQELEELFGAR